MLGVELTEIALSLRDHRIVMIGDIRRNGFEVARGLRALGVEIRVLGRQRDMEALASQETSGWMSDYGDLRRNPRSLIRLRKTLSSSRVDLVHARGGGVLLAALGSVPYVSQTVGSDLRDNLRGGLGPWYYRRCLARSRKLLISQIDHISLLPQDWPPWVHMPLLVDADAITPVPSVLDRDEHVVFHPANHLWNLDGGAVKGNDLLLRAFRRYLDLGYRARLVVLKRGHSWPDSLSLIEELGIGDHTTILGELDSRSLMQHYANADIVVDQFGGYGTPGLCALEAMCRSRPVICCINQDLCKVAYGDVPPIVSAWTEHEILDGLCELSDPDVRSRVGEAGREWVVRQHSWPVVAKATMETYLDILG